MIHPNQPKSSIHKSTDWSKSISHQLVLLSFYIPLKLHGDHRSRDPSNQPKSPTPNHPDRLIDPSQPNSPKLTSKSSDPLDMFLLWKGKSSDETWEYSVGKDCGLCFFGRPIWVKWVLGLMGWCLAEREGEVWERDWDLEIEFFNEEVNDFFNIEVNDLGANLVNEWDRCVERGIC